MCHTPHTTGVLCFAMLCVLVVAERMTIWHAKGPAELYACIYSAEEHNRHISDALRRHTHVKHTGADARQKRTRVTPAPQQQQQHCTHGIEILSQACTSKDGSQADGFIVHVTIVESGQSIQHVHIHNVRHLCLKNTIIGRV